jgi:hypothetical protein
VLAHWNHSPWVDMSIHSRHIIPILSQQILALSPYCCVQRSNKQDEPREATIFYTTANGHAIHGYRYLIYRTNVIPSDGIYKLIWYHMLDLVDIDIWYTLSQFWANKSLRYLLIAVCKEVTNKMNCELMLTYHTPPYMFNVYKNQLSRWFSPGIPVSSTNKTYRHDISWNIVESGIKHHNPNPF